MLPARCIARLQLRAVDSLKPRPPKAPRSGMLARKRRARGFPNTMKRFNRSFVIAAALSGVVWPASGERDAVLKSEFLYETAPTLACHASTIVETQGGLVTAWFGGSYEKHPDV